MSRHPPQRRRIALNAATTDEGDDDGGGDDDDDTTTPQRTYNNAASNKPQTRIASPFNDVPITNYQSSYTFGYLWLTQYMRSTLGWIGLTSFILLILNAFVFLLWLIERIPTIYYTFLYYGLMWYIFFLFVGVTTLVVSFSVDKTMHTVSFFFVVFAFLLSVFLWGAIFYQAYACYTGQLESQCADFYLTQFVLFGITVLISIDLLVMLILFTIVMMRVKDSFSSIDPQARL